MLHIGDFSHMKSFGTAQCSEVVLQRFPGQSSWYAENLLLLNPSVAKAKNPPDPCLFISTAIALSFAGLDVQSFPVVGSKNKFSLLVMFSIFV